MMLLHLHPMKPRISLNKKLLKGTNLLSFFHTYLCHFCINFYFFFSSCKFDVRDTQHTIVEGDVVILTSFFRPTYDRPVLEVESSKLAAFINTRSKTTKDNRDFIHNITEFGNIIEFALIATVREVTNEG